FAGYFLIVADFIQWAKAQDIPVGPGRGSGAGSLVAYALGITNLDPLPYDLLFERFLNPERVSMPDFDIDFCMEKRDKVIEYVAHKYGKNAVSQIITFGTMAAKAVVRDVGRVLGQPYGFVDKLAKLIPFELGITLETAIEQEPILKDRYEKEEEVRILLDLALKLEGITRSVGKHAGGVVIAPGDLSDFTPIYAESNDGAIVSQFDKNDVETIGLVKFDFLGLRTLTIIDWALKSIPDKVDIDSLALDDFKTLELLRSGETTAIFQLESRGMKELIIRLKPDNFEDIIALVALYRPGPLQSGMVDDFINRKHGLEPIEDLHPDIAYVLKPTYGIILYQEQVMQIAQVLAGYTLGGADLLRRAMGKKKPEEMAKQRSIFVEGSKARGVDAETAAYIFDLMEKFAGYGFNKSHSAAYALLTYQTAWLKAHYPGAFMAAVLSSDMNHTDKVVGFIEEVKRMKLNMLSPNINASAYYFSFNAKIGAIIYGLGAIKGVGEAAIENILETRKTKGAFKDLFDFCARVDLRKVTKRVLEALIKSGAFDDFIEHRAWALANLETAQHAAQQKASNNQKGQGDLFALLEEPEPIKTKPSQPWPLELQLKYEKEVLGFYLSGHPIQQYEQELAGMHVCPLKQLNLGSSKARVAGFILDIRTKINSKNKKMAFITLDDGSTRMEIPLFGEVYEKLGPQLIKDVLLIFDIEISKDFSGKMRLKIKVIYNIWQARKLFSKFVRIKVEPGQDFKNNQDLAQNLLKIIKQYASPLTENSQQLFVEYSLEAHEKPVRLKLAGCSILLNGQSFQAIQEAPGIAAVDLIY
ncbi:MAG: DNA polymerase III subunit alpha, partial [Gammaproteobacteria bacterium]